MQFPRVWFAVWVWLWALCPLSEAAPPIAPTGPSPVWGRIANGPHRGERLFCALYFAGPPNPRALPLYTRHPLHAGKLDAPGDAGLDYALKQMTSVGLNTLKLSYWGHEGEADRSAPTELFSRTRWLGDPKPGLYTEAEQIRLERHFFERARAAGLLVAPLLEVGPQFPFYAEFPGSLDNFVGRAAWLLRNFGDEPNWLRLYDRKGRPRSVVWLIETIHATPIDPTLFAQGFGSASLRLQQQTGYAAGFIVDPTPLPPYGSEAGPDPDALRQQDAVLAINPFNITSQGITFHAKLTEITEDERQLYAESVLRRWRNSGIPLIAPLLPGYDAHRVFPQWPSYGFRPAWRKRQTDLAIRYETDGLSFDLWNGWTEGVAVPPSVEDGTANFDWAKEAVRAVQSSQGQSPIKPGRHGNGG